MKPAGIIFAFLILTSLSVAAFPTRVIQTYDGAPLPAGEVARVYLQNGIIVRSLDGRVLLGIPGVLEVRPGAHALVVGYSEGFAPVGPAKWSEISVRLESDFAAGASYRIAANEKGRTWSPSIDPYKGNSAVKSENRVAACWADEIRGTIQEAQHHGHDIAMRLDGETETRWWKARAYVMAKPKSAVQSMASEATIDGKEQLYNIGANGLSLGQHVRAFVSRCDADSIVEIILDEKN